MAQEASFNPSALRRMAGERSFARGEDYFNNGRVRSLEGYEGTITAKVHGDQGAYRVKLRDKGGGLDYDCSCPMGIEGDFCKHCVAVGLAWLHQKAGNSKGGGKVGKPSVTMEDVRSHLGAQGKDALVKLLMDQAMNDDRLRQRLLLAAAKKGSKGIALSTYRRAIDDAVSAGDFVDYRALPDYASRIGEAVESVEELLKEGHADEAVEICEYALAAVEGALGSVDDSDGLMGGLLEDLQEIHLQACRKAKPDPGNLARRLFDWELNSEWETFLGAAESYADVLGKEGLASYRKLAEVEWVDVPALGPGGKDEERYGKRFRITRIMETLARQSGDVEALVEVKKRELSSAYGFLGIARTYKEAGKHDSALDWAEQGLKAFPGDTHPDLREFLAEEYHRRKRHDEAIKVVWDGFAGSPGLDEYKKLKKSADRAAQWPSWREKAIALLRKKGAKEAADARLHSRGLYGVGRSELVRVFLWERNLEAAWREAQEGGCAEGLWMELAAKREKEHPADSLPIYQKRVEPTLDRKNNEAYGEAVGLLRKIRDLMIRLGREADFKQYMAVMRLKHKAKRNFMALLEKEKWG